MIRVFSGERIKVGRYLLIEKPGVYPPSAQEVKPQMFFKLTFLAVVRKEIDTQDRSSPAEHGVALSHLCNRLFLQK